MKPRNCEEISSQFHQRTAIIQMKLRGNCATTRESVWEGCNDCRGAEQPPPGAGRRRSALSVDPRWTTVDLLIRERSRTTSSSSSHSANVARNR